MRAGGQRHAAAADRHPALPAVRVRHRDRTGGVRAVDLDVECSTRSGRRDARVDRVAAGRRDRDGVLQPLAGRHVPERVSAAGIRRARDVDVGLPIRSAEIAGCRIVIRDAFTAIVEVLGFDEARDRRGSSAERRRTRRRDAGASKAQRVEVPHVAGAAIGVEHDAEDVRSRRERDAAAADGDPGLPAICVRHGQRTGHVGAVDLDVEVPTGSRRRDACFERVVRSRRHRDGVLQPLAARHVRQRVTAAGVERARDVDVGLPIRAA